jgi:hypothetical protein
MNRDLGRWCSSSLVFLFCWTRVIHGRSSLSGVAVVFVIHGGEFGRIINKKEQKNKGENILRNSEFISTCQTSYSNLQGREYIHALPSSSSVF